MGLIHCDIYTRVKLPTITKENQRGRTRSEENMLIVSHNDGKLFDSINKRKSKRKDKI